MHIFLSGGCKNGKSTYAEQLAVLAKKSESSGLYYIATMLPRDSEDDARVKRHREGRAGLGFETIECGKGISSICGKYDKDASFLLDSTTALLDNEMFTPSGEADSNAYLRVAEEITQLLSYYPKLVIVSDYIYSCSREYGSLTIAYQRSLAYIDRVCAKQCDIVLEACYGSFIVHKGKEELHATSVARGV